MWSETMFPLPVSSALQSMTCRRKLAEYERVRAWLKIHLPRIRKAGAVVMSALTPIRSPSPHKSGVSLLWPNVQ